ncbi:MAG: type VI secretion system-associated FHA domain protein TagH [Woeseiaceae bacterium]
MMSLKLEIVSEHREIVGDDAIREFHGEGGTIGRSLNNDWILPDPDRFISGKHATIDCKGGTYYLADLSTNGVYVNNENEPIGKGNPRRLFNGDLLHFGDFEISVTIDEGEDLEMPDPPKPTVVPDHIEQLVDEEPLKTGVQLLDEEEITGDADFESVLYPGAEPVPEATVEEDEEVAPEPPAIAEPKQVEVTGQDVFDAFLDGLQISRSELHPSIDVGEAMRNAGEVLREFVAGTEKLLASRAELKSAFRLDQTSILPRRNNPLKLSNNTGDLIKQLLIGREGEYLGPRDAVREVNQDLLAHQDAFLDAMTEAFVDFAERFDPDELTASFDRSLGRKPLFSFMAEMRYWSLYRDLYPIMTEKGGERFPQMFAEEFVKAYEHQIVESLRENRGNTGLPKVKLEPLDEEKYKAEQAAKQAANDDEGELEDQTEPAYQTGPVETLEDIEHLDELDELIDFDDLEEKLEADPDDSDQAKA